jgi:hypothetical protein
MGDAFDSSVGKKKGNKKKVALNSISTVNRWTGSRSWHDTLLAQTGRGNRLFTARFSAVVQLTLFYRAVSMWRPYDTHRDNMFLDTRRSYNVILLQHCKSFYTAQRNFPRHSLHEEHFASMCVNNFRWAPYYFSFEYYTLQRCMYVSQGQVTTLHNQSYRDTSRQVNKHRVTGEGWAASSGQVRANKFLSSQRI